MKARIVALCVALAIITEGASHLLAQAGPPPLNPTHIANVDRVLDESPCDEDRRALASRALWEIEGAITDSGRIEVGRLPATLLRGLGALSNADETSRATTISGALSSTEGQAALRAQCGDPEALGRRTRPMSAEDRVRAVWRACHLDRVGLTRPRRDIGRADLHIHMVAVVVGFFRSAAVALAPVEVRLLQTMLSGAAPRCGTRTPERASPSWLPEGAGVGAGGMTKRRHDEQGAMGDRRTAEPRNRYGIEGP